MWKSWDFCIDYARWCPRCLLEIYMLDDACPVGGSGSSSKRLRFLIGSWEIWMETSNMLHSSSSHLMWVCVRIWYLQIRWLSINFPIKWHVQGITFSDRPISNNIPIVISYDKYHISLPTIAAYIPMIFLYRGGPKGTCVSRPRSKCRGFPNDTSGRLVQKKMART